jgi:hypothetical protein
LCKGKRPKGIGNMCVTVMSYNGIDEGIISDRQSNIGMFDFN